MCLATDKALDFSTYALHQSNEGSFFFLGCQVALSLFCEVSRSIGNGRQSEPHKNHVAYKHRETESSCLNIQKEKQGKAVFHSWKVDLEIQLDGCEQVKKIRNKKFIKFL